ncbi:MAG: hypothetical protein NXI24_10930 [bacterium]|nr:hypothetical protein [bacterium]
MNYKADRKAQSGRGPYLLRIGLCVLLILMAGEASAETILLKNGQILSGKVVSQNKTSITIQTEAGRRTILKSRIQRIDYKSAAEVRRQEQERRRKQEEARRKAEAERRAREAAARKAEAERNAREEAARKAEAERRARKEAARKAEAERNAREEAARKAEAERKAQEIEAARKAEAEAAENNENAQPPKDPSAEDVDPGLSLAELFGEAVFGGGFELHDAAAADFFFDGPTNTAGGNHLFERGMGSDGALAPVLFYERSVWDPRLVPGIEVGFLYRKDTLRPGLLYPALSGWEFFVRPGLGARFELTEDLALHLRGYYAFAATQMGREFYGPEWTLDRGLVLDRLDGIQRYRIRNPQSAGPGLRIAFEFDRFRLWIGRQWMSGRAGDARIYRDNWVAGLGVRL